MSEENYSRVEDNVVMETQAEISYLARNIMMAMNDIFCPNTTYTAADGTTYTVLDTANCSVGADAACHRMSSLQEKDMTVTRRWK